MEKGIFDIQLMKLPMTNGCHCKEQSNGSHLCHGRKGITIIKTINLSVPFCNQSSFESINVTIRTDFNCIYPSTTNSLFAWGKWHKLPSMTVVKSLHFFNHCLSPSRMIKCFFHTF
ncbi:hypothetical protein VIGAN_02062800, partial [Vigna angularis var. angularis]